MLLSRRSFVSFVGMCLAAPSAAPARNPFPADREEMVPVPGGRIYVRMNGRVTLQRPPLLIVHGGPGSGHSGYIAMTALADDRAVILYDQLDNGQSDRPGDPHNWHIGRFVDEIAAIRSAFGLRRIHLYGASFGGLIALEYAARRPKGLTSTILQSPQVSVPQWAGDMNQLRQTLPQETQDLFDRCEAGRASNAECRGAIQTYNSKFQLREPRPPLIEEYRRSVGAAQNDQMLQTMWGRRFFTSDGTLRSYDGTSLLSRLDGRRTLFIAGEFDKARPETVARFAALANRAQSVVIAGSGHNIINDRPAQLLELVRAWLNRHD